MPNKKIQSAYLDEGVILTMLIVSVAALMITVVRYTNYEYCAPFNLNSKAEFYHTGEPIRFETDAQNIKTLQWDFGDNAKNQTKINSAVHVYKQPGEYLVSTTLNGTCSEYKTVFISKAPKLENPLLTPNMFCPQTAEVGKPVEFKDSTAGARSWEWRFGETATVDATSSQPTYTYKIPGLKTISLVINGNPQQMAVCKLYVNEPTRDSIKTTAKQRSKKQPPFILIPAKPITPSVENQTDSTTELAKPKAESLSRQELEARLRKVADKLLNADAFSQYLCGNLNIPVSLNGKEITFTQFCNKLASLKSQKKIKELNVQQFTSKETNCIVGLNVSLKTKGKFFGIF